VREKILIVEDEEGIVLSLEDRLKSEGYRTVARWDGRSGEAEALSRRYDLIILDVMLPERDGFQVCRNLRDAGVSIPILMLTARSTTIDTVTGLRTGADDYLTKPFDMQELLARVYALLRRQQRQDKEADPIEPIIRFGDFSIDTRKQELRRKTESIPLNTKEYRLLKYLVENPHRVIGRNELLDEVWGYDSVTSTRTVDVHIAWLRQKLGEKPGARHLLTIRGQGYRFTPD
jgi:DNA-binding response OmpR family regulator